MMNANPNSWTEQQQPPTAASPHDDQQLAASPLPAAGEVQYTHEAVAAAAAAPLTLADHKVRISEAMRLTDDGMRDTALLFALRGISAELEVAEEEHVRSAKRVQNARELFDWATGALSGYSKTKEPKGEDLVKRGRKRKGEIFSEVDYEDKFTPPDEGPLTPPLVATSGGGMTDQQVAAHRDAFYQKLVGLPYSELSEYTPGSHLANMKSKAQLEECIYIATHWNTGVDGMDVMDFRRQHKTFYTKMKVTKDNIGRRTGHHLRDVAGHEGRKAFCRYGKNDESLMYAAVEELYDAIFEMHCLTGHRGWQATKRIANLKYANVPQDQVKAFVETCPVCSSKKGGTRNPRYMKKAEDEEEGLMML